MEKRVVVFVLAAFVLGLVTKCYRDAHPSPPPSPTNKRHYSSAPATGAVALQRRLPLVAETRSELRNLKLLGPALEHEQEQK
jgi:hypothetical protein